LLRGLVRVLDPRCAGCSPAANPLSADALQQLPKLCATNLLSVAADQFQCIGTDACIMPW